MANPIIQRELIGTLREKRTIVAFGVLSFVFAMLIAIRWPTEARMALSGARSQQVFRLFIYGLLVAVLLLLPVFPATSLVKERNRGTLALLLNTPLGPWKIFSGKLLASWGLAVLMLCVSLPAASACIALGGVSLGSGLGGCYLVLLMTAVELCSVSLLVSTLTTTTDAAIRMAYGVIGGICLLSMIPYALFVGQGGFIETIADWLRCLSPVSAISSLLGGADALQRGITSETSVVGRFVILTILIIVASSLATVRRLNFRIFDRVRSAGVIVDELSHKTRLLRRLLFLVDPGRRSRPIGPLTNPIMVKEFRCRRFGRLHWLLRLISICALLSILLAFVTATQTIAWDVATISGILVILQVTLLVLITPSLTAGLICTERESGGWVLLQMSPLSVGRILGGKLLSVFLTLALVLCSTLPGYVVMIWIDPGTRPQIERVVVSLLVTSIYATLVSAAVGCLFRYTSNATAAAYSILIAICTLPLLVWAGRGAPFGQATVEGALSINPIATALSIIRFPGFEEYDLIPAFWWVAGVASLISLGILLLQTIRLSRPQ